MKHRHEIRVIFGDTDQMGVVYYANYLRFFESSRAAYWRALGRSYKDLEAAQIALPVIEAHCNYRRPAYYEDTDYCFKLHDKGYRVYYQPAARVVHHEGASCGTDLTQGPKRHQVINREKFQERWKSALERHPERPAHENLEAWQRLAVRPA